MTIWLDHVLLVLLAALFPLWAATFGFRSLVVATPEDLPRVRLRLYRRAITIQWTLVAVVVALWIAQGRSWLALGLVPRFGGGLLGVLAGLLIVTVFVWRQRRAALGDDESLAAVRRQLHRIERLLPTDAREMGWFVRLSVTAGICEEILYRGYLFWYLGHWFEPIPTAAIAALLFGIGHSYQGLRGVVLTTAVGAFLGMIYGVSGSLLAPMLIHALMDVHSGHLGFVAFRREREERERLATEAAEREAALAFEAPDDTLV